MISFLDLKKRRFNNNILKVLNKVIQVFVVTDPNINYAAEFT
jgi:hypothetical protein